MSSWHMANALKICEWGSGERGSSVWKCLKARTWHGPEMSGESFLIQQSETGIYKDSDDGGCLEHASKPRRKEEKPLAWLRP